MEHGIPEVGEEMKDMTVTSVGEKGDGIVKTENGFIIFVKESKKGEIVNIRVRKVFEKFAFADIIKEGESDAVKNE